VRKGEVEPTRRKSLKALSQGILLFCGVILAVTGIAAPMLGISTWGYSAVPIITGLGLISYYLAYTTGKRMFKIALLLAVVLLYTTFFHLIGWL
jgi:Flp pilus assembly protein TadB